MKLIACLIVLSLISAFWSTGLVSPRVNPVPASHTVLEQLERDHAPIPPWWGWDMWAARVVRAWRRRRRTRRQWHKPGRVERWLRQFRR